MEPNNRLTLTYLQTHPDQAARTLEKLPAELVARFFEEIDAPVAARILDGMLPAHAGAGLAEMKPSTAARILERMAVLHIARLIQMLNNATANRLLELLSMKNRFAVRHLLKHPTYTVGSIMNAVHFLLSENLTAGDALRRIKRYPTNVSGDIFVVDGLHRLVGTVTPTALLRADQRTMINRIMRPRPPTLHARARIVTSAAHPAWRKFRLLPVVEGDYSLVGSVDYETILSESSSERPVLQTSDTFGVLLDLARLYWISVASLLEALTAGRVRPKT